MRTTGIREKAHIANCKTCGQPFVYKRGKPSECSQCKHHRRRERMKAYYVEKFGGSCARCGYNEFNRCLAFHHVDSEEKDGEISQLLKNASKKRIDEEISKCILLCHNCHNAFHYGFWERINS